jgi:hypothetical protein
MEDALYRSLMKATPYIYMWKRTVAAFATPDILERRLAFA